MSTCEKLRRGYDARCVSVAKKYYQQVVLVNRDDVEEKLIVVSQSTIDDSYECRHRAYFRLKEGKTGYLFAMGENSSQIFGSFEKTVSEGIAQYSHDVNIVLLGVDEQIKCLIKQLDSGDYFAALQYYDDTIELFGFEYGLTTSNYNYDPANLEGGAIIKLNSLSTSLEDEPPFVYGSDTPVEDFDNLFSDNQWSSAGDFNSDFSNDFDNESI